MVSRFRVPADGFAEFAVNARAAIAALAACPGFVSAELGQATDDPELRIIASRWVSIGAYRRALSSYDVKLTAIPFLSHAIDEPSAYEVVHERTPESVREAGAGLAADAGDVGLGEAAAAEVPGVVA